MTEGMNEILVKLQVSAKENQCTEKWPERLPQIITLIHKIITSTYNTPTDKEVVPDPLNPNQKRTIGELADDLCTLLKSNFSQSPPFTIVRLIELLSEPVKWCTTAEKFMRALQNILCVEASIDDFKDAASSVVTAASSSQYEEIHNNGNVQGVAVGDEIVMLSKIDWLTDEQVREVTSKNYLLESTDGYIEEEDDDYDPDSSEIGETGAEDEDNITEEEENITEEEESITEENDGKDVQTEEDAEIIRKRKSEGIKAVVDESPEKKFKTDTSGVEDEDDETSENVPTDPIEEPEEDEESIGTANTTLEDDKMQVD